VFVRHGPGRPITLSAAAAVEALEGLAVVGAGAYLALATIAGQSRDVPSAVALAVVTIITGVLMIMVGRGLLGRRRWSRSPAVVTQLFLLVIAVPMARDGQYALGVPLVAAAVAGLGLLLAPPTARALLDEPPTDEPPKDEEPADKTPR
jgi:hypothetical protein